MEAVLKADDDLISKEQHAETATRIILSQKLFTTDSVTSFNEELIHDFRSIWEDSECRTRDETRILFSSGPSHSTRQ